MPFTIRRTLFGYQLNCIRAFADEKSYLPVDHFHCNKIMAAIVEHCADRLDCPEFPVPTEIHTRTS